MCSNMGTAPNGGENSLYKMVAGSDSYVFDSDYQKAMADASKYYNEGLELRDEISELYKELDKELLVDPSLGRSLSSALGLYTDKGQEINEKIRKLRQQEEVIDDNWSKATDIIKRKDAKAREDQLKAYQSPPVKLATQDSYKGFEMDTHTPYLQEKLSKGDAFIAEMSPKQYLERCAYDVFNKGTIESTVRGTVPANVKKYAKMMKQGTRFYMPSLNYDDRQQEGRHRALAAMINGYDKIPVLIVPKKR